MKTVYFYIYFHLYILVSKFNKRNAREGAIVYFSLIILFSSWPFVVVTLKNILNVPSTVFIIVMVIYMSLIFYTNKKYIQKLHRLKEIYQRFKNESVPQIRLGYIVVVSLFFTSLISGFFILYFLDNIE